MFSFTARRWLLQLLHLLETYRVRITALAFIAVIGLEMYFGTRPLDLRDWRHPLIPLAVLLIVLGLLCRSWAAGTLRKNRELATTGPYQWVRHPLYFGSLLMLVGFCVLIGSPWNFVLGLGPLAIAYLYAIRREERHVASIFGDEWRDYAARTPLLIPWSLPRSWSSNWSWQQWYLNGEYNAYLGAAAGLAGLVWWQCR